MNMPTDPARELADLGRLTATAAEWLERHGERLGAVVEDVSKWSPRMQIDHAALAAASVCGAVERILAGAPGCVEPGEPSAQLSAILTTGFIPRGTAEAPEKMRPAAGVTHDEALAHVAALRGRLDALTPRVAEIASAGLRFPHFALGPMTASEWLLFARIHTDHHLAIARDILDL